MLALEFDSEKVPKFPLYIQPKLDGVRCLVYRSGDNIVFQSRQNTLYEPFEHLLPELEILFGSLEDPNDFIFDGELYTHGMSFESITGIVRRSKNKHSDTAKIKYHIYDCFYSGEDNIEKNNKPYSYRYSILKKLFSDKLFANLVLVETSQANCLKDIEDYHTHYTTLEHPYEGIMLRTPNSPYKQQGRSKDLQKYKKFKDEEFEIIGHHEGTGSHSGTPIMECRSKENPDKTFSVTLQGTLEYKKEIMKNIDSYYGKLLIVKYQEKSKDGIPRFPIGLGFRDYE
jgi:DNA ligase-1